MKKVRKKYGYILQNDRMQICGGILFHKKNAIKMTNNLKTIHIIKVRIVNNLYNEL
jgi:hypothetical protein